MANVFAAVWKVQDVVKTALLPAYSPYENLHRPNRLSWQLIYVCYNSATAQHLKTTKAPVTLASI